MADNVIQCPVELITPANAWYWIENDIDADDDDDDGYGGDGGDAKLTAREFSTHNLRDLY